jgi:hypothetical protein
MREIRLLRGRLPRKGGGLTGMIIQWSIEKEPKDKQWFTKHYTEKMEKLKPH